MSQFPVFREHQPPPVPVGGWMCGNETGSGRESEEQARTFCLSSTHLAFPTPAAHVPTGVRVGGGGRKAVRQAPTPKYRATVGESELSQPPVTCAQAGGEHGIIIFGTWDLRRKGVEDPAARVLGQVSTSQHLGDFGENGWGPGPRVLGRRGGDERGQECPVVGSAGERRRYRGAAAAAASARGYAR